MRSSTVPITLASLTLLLSFQEQASAFAQLQVPEAGPSRVATILHEERRSYAAPADDSFYEDTGPIKRASSFKSQMNDVSQDPKAQSAKLKKRQRGAAVSAAEDTDDNAATAADVRAARASSASVGALAPTRGVDRAQASEVAASIVSSMRGSVGHPGAAISNGPSVPIPTEDPEVTSASSAPARSTASTSTSASASSTASTSDTTSSTPSTSTSSSSSSSTSSTPTSTSTSTSSTPSTSSTTETASSTSSSPAQASEPDSSAQLTSVWAAFNRSSKYFPFAVVITVVIGIAILVGLVAILQCIARAPRFRKDKRPLLLPSDTTWSDSNASHPDSDMRSRRGSIISEKQGGKAWEAFVSNSSPASRVNSRSSRQAGSVFEAPTQDSNDSNSESRWEKEDFLPHSRTLETPYTLNHASPYSAVDVYPAMPKFSGMPNNFGGPYPPFPNRDLRANSLPRYTPTGGESTVNPNFSTTLPVIRRMESAIQPSIPTSTLAPPNGRGISRMNSLLYKPRPGPAEQQSGHRASWNGGHGLPSHVVLPPGVAERRRWERCST